MRGYFGIGIERVSKPRNIGALFRTAHAFGASFVFTLDGQHRDAQGYATDTSKTDQSVPFYEFPSLEAMTLPKGCRMVGVELLDDAVDLPSFRHPHACAYILGQEKGNLSSAVLDRCDAVIKIPTKFCLNVGLAGAVIMYDRYLSMGRYGQRPARSGGVQPPSPSHQHGGRFVRAKKYLAPPPEMPEE